jgi:hypothetical protein
VQILPGAERLDESRVLGQVRRDPHFDLAVVGGRQLAMTITYIVRAVKSRRREQRIVAEKLPHVVATGILTPADVSWLGSMRTRKSVVQAALRFGGRTAGSTVKKFALQVVELAYVRDRIDRGFGDERVFALQHEESHRVLAARAAAAPVLHQVQAHWFPVSR